MQRIVFTVAMTCISRSLLFRDRLLGRLSDSSHSELHTLNMIRCSFPSGSHTLDAIFAQPQHRPAAALLICHGIGEIVDHWRGVQRLLAENGIASLVFDYSGYGRSTGYIDAAQCERDAVAAFAFLREQVPSVPISVLGFSLGSGIATAIVSEISPHRLVLCASYTSMKDAMRCTGIVKPLTFLLPDLWNTRKLLRDCAVPVLLVHGEEDRLFPCAMAEELAACASSPCELIVVRGLSHNDPIYRPQLSYWSEIISRL